MSLTINCESFKAVTIYPAYDHNYIKCISYVYIKYYRTLYLFTVCTYLY